MQMMKKPLSFLLLATVLPAWSLDTARVSGPVGTELPMGQVLAWDAQNSVFVPLDHAANDGTEVAAAVLVEPVDGVATVPLIRRGAVVNAAALVWPAGITAGQTSAAINQLEVRGIVTRTVL